MTNRTILDVGDDKIEFINEFLVDMCISIDPDVDMNKLIEGGKLIGIQMPNEQFFYLYNKEYHLLHVDIKLLIDGT